MQDVSHLLDHVSLGWRYIAFNQVFAKLGTFHPWGEAGTDLAWLWVTFRKIAVRISMHEIFDLILFY